MAFNDDSKLGQRERLEHGEQQLGLYGQSWRVLVEQSWRLLVGQQQSCGQVVLFGLDCNKINELLNLDIYDIAE